MFNFLTHFKRCAQINLDPKKHCISPSHDVIKSFIINFLFDIFEKKVENFGVFFEKSNQKINELFNFNFKFQNEFLSGDKSDNEKKEPQPYTLTQEKNHLHICYTF